MLTLIEEGNGTRGDFLRIGSAAIGELTLPGLLATVMHTLFDIGEARLLPDLPEELEQVITGGEPIAALF